MRRVVCFVCLLAMVSIAGATVPAAGPSPPDGVAKDSVQSWNEELYLLVFQPMAERAELRLQRLGETAQRLRAEDARRYQQLGRDGGDVDERLRDLAAELERLVNLARRWHERQERTGLQATPLDRLRLLRAEIRQLARSLATVEPDLRPGGVRGTGAVAGTVTDEATGTGLSAVEVDIYNASGSWVDYGYTDGSGNYTTYGYLDTGTFFARTYQWTGLSYIDEIYDDIPAAGNSVTSGTPISVTDGAVTPGIDFALALGARIGGIVTDSGSAAPIQSVYVTVYDPAGNYLGYDYTDTSGVYISYQGFPPGEYRVYARDSNFAHLAEIWDNHPCGDQTCSNAQIIAGDPVTTTVGVDTTGIDFALDPGGTISGTVTDGAGTPIFNAHVRVYDAAGTYRGYDYTDSSGNYTTRRALLTGNHFVTVQADGYLGELYDDLPCVGSCTVTSGTAVSVTVGVDTPGIDFALDLSGGISGTVTASATGLPLVNMYVRAYDASGNGIATDYTDSSGVYVLSQNMVPGTYYVRVYSDPTYIGELYDDIPCPSGCTVTSGTPVTVGSGITTGIDFALDQGASLAGTVTALDTGSPITTAYVDVYDSGGGWVSYGYTDGAGSYVTWDPLLPGDHFARAWDWNGVYTTVLYDGIPCPSGCDVTTGTAISVTAGATVTGIDFALPSGTTISGTVTDDPSGAPIANVIVELYDASGSYLDGDFTDGSGSYIVGNDLATGSYHLRTWDVSGQHRLNELYDGFPCESYCDVTVGTAVTVTNGFAVSGIDFALAAGGSITGMVTGSDTGLPIPNTFVEIYSPEGDWLSYGFSDGSGAYLGYIGLRTGSKILRAYDWNTGEYITEFYDGIACPFGACEFGGTPVPVVSPAVTPDIDFTLDRGGMIAGTVTDADTAAPLTNVRVYLFTETGTYLGYRWTDGAGAYQWGGLGAGAYYAVTYNTSGYLDELHDGVFCPSLSCDFVIEGTPIVVALGATATVDFALNPARRIAGAVTDVLTGAPLPFVEVDIFDAGGSFVAYGYTDGSGTYVTSTGLLPGAYTARATEYGGGGYTPELWDDIPCLGACDPATGMPIVVAMGADTTGIDFALGAQAITGTVTDVMREPLAPRVIADAEVWLHDQGGAFLLSTSIDGAGDYAFAGIPPGTYFVRTFNVEGFDDELYDDLPCEPVCDVTTGTPVVVAPGAVVSGIDFGLTSDTSHLLYDQMGPWYQIFTEQDFEPAYDAYDAQGADDFVVPNDEAWVVEEIRIASYYGTAGSAAEGLHVSVYRDEGGLPGAPVCEHPNATYGSYDAGNEHRVVLPEPCPLGPGTYWLGIQGRMDLNPWGQFYWILQQSTIGLRPAWRNPGDGFATGCTDWTSYADCFGSTDTDYIFSIHGHKGIVPLFADGFESGDLCSWSDAVPPLACGGADESVLIYYDSFSGNEPAEAAANELGWAVTATASSTEFAAAYDAQPWGVVVVDVPGGGLPAEVRTRVLDRIAAGERLIFSWWFLDSDAALAAAMEVATTTYSPPNPVYVATGASVNLFTSTETVNEPLTNTQDAGDNGDYLAPTAGGEILMAAGSPGGLGLAVQSNGGMTLALGFLPYDYQDTNNDGDAILDMTELFMNMLVHIRQ